MGIQFRVSDALDARQDVADFGTIGHAVCVFLQRGPTIGEGDRRAKRHGKLHINNGLGVGLVFLWGCDQLVAAAEDANRHFLNVFRGQTVGVAKLDEAVYRPLLVPATGVGFDAGAGYEVLITQVL